MEAGKCLDFMEVRLDSYTKQFALICVQMNGNNMSIINALRLLIMKSITTLSMIFSTNFQIF